MDHPEGRALLAKPTVRRSAVGDHAIGELLAKSSIGADGIWPCEPIRQALEGDLGTKDIADGMGIGLYNLRGVTWARRGRGNRSGSLRQNTVAGHARWPSTYLSYQGCLNLSPASTIAMPNGMTRTRAFASGSSIDGWLWIFRQPRHQEHRGLLRGLRAHGGNASICHSTFSYAAIRQDDELVLIQGRLRLSILPWETRATQFVSKSVCAGHHLLADMGGDGRALLDKRRASRDHSKRPTAA